MKQTKGKILLHHKGSGVIGEDEVVRRAREIAATEGRTDCTRDDLVRARDELSGNAMPPTLESDEDGTVGASRDPSEPVADRGHKTPGNDELDYDEQDTVERLVIEGVEEAQHEQMVAGRRKQRKDSGS